MYLIHANNDNKFRQQMSQEDLSVANTKVSLRDGRLLFFATLSEFAAHTAKVDD